MIDSIFVAMSGMQGHERGLRVIGNNVANMNTPGFRGSTVSFTDVFLGAGNTGQLVGQQGAGGLGAALALLDTQPGTTQQTGRDLDLSLEGAGFFIVQDETGEIRYTRNGSFELVEGALLTRAQRLKVMTLNATGRLVPFEIGSLQRNPPRATSKVTFERTLSSSDTDSLHTIDSLVVFDKAGGQHTLKVEFRKQAQNTGNIIRWKVTVLEDGTEIGSGDLEFLNSSVNPSTESLQLTLALKGTDPAPITFDFAEQRVNFIDIGANSNLQVKEQDGHGEGAITSQTFDQNGVLQLAYSNGEKAEGPKLAFAVIADEAKLAQAGGSLFEFTGSEPVVLREAGDDLKVTGRSLEGSNVDLTEEFSELILMQRGYQASSQVVSTANEMLEQLFQLKGGR